MGIYPDNEKAIYTENDMETLRNTVRKLTLDNESYRKILWCLIEASGGKIIVSDNILSKVDSNCLVRCKHRLDLNAIVYRTKQK